MTVHQHYRRLRRKGWHASQALHAARTFALADEISDDEVRVRIMPDEDPSTALDFDGTKEEKEREYKRAERDGVWGIVGEWRNPATEQWQHADSVWGFVGDDWEDSGYDSAVLQAAIDAYLATTKPLATMLQSEGVGL